MREIQDLTLQVERGLAAVGQRFVERREQFGKQFERFGRDSDHSFGIRATLIPLTRLYVDRVHDNEAVRPPLRELSGMIGGQAERLFLPRHGGPWRPILRGSRSGENDDRRQIHIEVHQDGLIEYVFLMCQRNHALCLFPAWLMGLFGNALCAGERFRRAAGAPDIEYALEFEIVNSGCDLPIGRYGNRSHMLDGWLGPLPQGRTIFPQYSIGSRKEFQQISRLFETDFWNNVGHDVNTMLTIDFNQAFRELGIAPSM